MASAANMSVAPAKPDPEITVKVNFQGQTRRTKMSLRDMVPITLERNIRTFLQIPDGSETLLERYSDSATSYIRLDRENVSVYKQLFRAAKAKSKLKIRVTVTRPPCRTIPLPVTVEDEPESESAGSETKTTGTSTEEEVAIQEASPAPSPPVADAPAPSPAETTLPLRTLSRTYDASLLQNAAKFITDEVGDGRREFEQRLASLVERQSGLAQRVAAHHAQRARLGRNMPPSCPRSDSSSISPWSQPGSLHSAAIPRSVMVGEPSATFAVCCNSCEKTIPDAHYHCSSCDDGDFDLCPECVDQGITCHGKEHWLIKRTTVNGHIVQSVTEKISPKPSKKATEKTSTPSATVVKPAFEEFKLEEPKTELPCLTKPTCKWGNIGIMRTCNSCVQELPEHEFLHCTTCDDFDLCQMCFAGDSHGHHPKHAFLPAVKGTRMPDHINARMAPGRNQLHHAICDGCDNYITGVRYKCLDCPDWDYCAECNLSIKFSHPNHRFVPIYEQLDTVRTQQSRSVHVGICCDGPLCRDNEVYPSYIRGTRYKCAVCYDVDFCANCEASPASTHNKTHPLIMFKTPVRHVSVTTTGEHADGHEMPVMGDGQSIVSKSSETTLNGSESHITTDKAPVDVEHIAEEEKPQAMEPQPEEEEKEAVPPPAVQAVHEQDLKASFVQDTISDGTILPPNHVFEQSWTLRNDGQENWPAGCSVKFVGGDYMGHVDPNHPAGISELVSASESTVCYAPLAPGQEFSFTVLLRTPARAGKVISYWRLATSDGFKFGHRLWCDVNVRMIKEVPRAIPAPQVKAEMEEQTNEQVDSQASSQMIFPKLEKESPVASIHEAAEAEVEAVPAEVKIEDKESDDGWDLSDDGFMTDEEYDILDASDEEYLEEQKKKFSSK